MLRANRYFLPDYIWHITHRCHKKEFLLKFSRDRERWISWLFEARNRKKVEIDEKHVLREAPERYKVDFASQMGCLTPNNLLFWDKI